MFKRLLRWKKEHIYKIPNQYQGRIKKLYVLGDKKSWCNTEEMITWVKKSIFESELNSLQETLDLPIKFIQLIRNPFDVIISRKAMVDKKRGGNRNLSQWSRMYFQHHKIAKKLEKFCLTDENFTFHKMYQEELISEPKKQLKELCEFLEVEPFSDYIKDCSSIIFDKPRKTSKSRDWLDEEKKFIYDEIFKHEELKHYVL